MPASPDCPLTQPSPPNARGRGLERHAIPLCSLSPERLHRSGERAGVRGTLFSSHPQARKTTPSAKPRHSTPENTRYNATRRNRSALPTTDTELTLIASAATIGDSIQPSHGYSAPAASGTPMPL